MLNKAAQKSQLLMSLLTSCSKNWNKILEKGLWMTSVRSCLVNLKVIGLHFCQTGPPDMNCFKDFGKTISFHFFIFESYVCCCKFYWLNQSFLKRQTSGISSDNEWQEITMSDKNDNEYNTRNDCEWQRVTTNDNKWQQVVKLMKTVKYTSKNGLPFFCD